MQLLCVNQLRQSVYFYIKFNLVRLISIKFEIYMEKDHTDITEKVKT